LAEAVQGQSTTHRAVKKKKKNNKKETRLKSVNHARDRKVIWCSKHECSKGKDIGDLKMENSGKRKVGESKLTGQLEEELKHSKD
jgi:hypothetical protein